jgi:glutathione peroxidase
MIPTLQMLAIRTLSAPATALLTLLLCLWGASAQAQAQPASCPQLLQHSFNRLQDDKPQPLCQYAGKVLLVVNTASYCGFTPQYEGLEALHARYAARGLVVMGFPSNDFAQESGTSAQIADLCFNTYGVKFPMFAKTAVVGPQANPFFAALTQATGKPPAWNFHKFLVDGRGKPVAAFSSNVKPTDAALVAAIEKALAVR